MNLIFDMLDITDKLADELKLSFNPAAKYNDIINNAIADISDIHISFRLRTDIIAFLTANNIVMKNEVMNYLFEKTYEDYNSMSDTELVVFYGYILRSINFVQKDNLLLLKYNIKVFNSGWYDLLKLCRGKVVDIETRKVVTYPFDKFFNINEVPGYEFDTINELTRTASYIFVSDKIDGSTISVSKYNGNLLITTNGAFENDMTEWARQLLDEKYPEFESNIKDGYTYIFELVHPDNRIILNYGNKKCLYLLNIREHKTYKLLPLAKVHKVAKVFGFEIPQVFDFGSLQYLITLAQTSSNTNKEGWVLRIGQPDGTEKMVKIKYEEYFALHRIKDHLRAKHVYDAMLGGYLDDMLAVASDETRATVVKYANEISQLQKNIEKEVIETGNGYLNKYHTTLSDIDEGVKISLIQDILSSKYTYRGLVVVYIKHPQYLTEHILRLRRGKVKNELREIDKKVNM